MHTSVEWIRSTRSLSSPLKRRPMLSRFKTSCPPSITEDTRLPLRLGNIYQNQKHKHTETDVSVDWCQAIATNLKRYAALGQIDGLADHSESTLGTCSPARSNGRTVGSAECIQVSMKRDRANGFGELLWFSTSVVLCCCAAISILKTNRQCLQRKKPEQHPTLTRPRPNVRSPSA